MSKKLVPGILRFTSVLFLIFQKVMRNKLAAGILRSVSMLFLIFEKGMSKKNCARNFKIRKYAFLKT